MSDPLAWMEHAACAGMDPELFFPEVGGVLAYETSFVRQTCGGCPVRAECLADAMAEPARIGVWGGTTLHERRRLRHAG